MADEESKGAVITEAIAEYLEIEAEDVRGWVVGVERMTESGVTFSSVWSVNVPIWGLLGFVSELKRHLLRQHPDHQLQATNGVAPSRAVRRRRGSRQGGKQ